MLAKKIKEKRRLIEEEKGRRSENKRRREHTSRGNVIPGPLLCYFVRSLNKGVLNNWFGFRSGKEKSITSVLGKT